jgi:hypothetical protein
MTFTFENVNFHGKPPHSCLLAGMTGLISAALVGAAGFLYWNKKSRYLDVIVRGDCGYSNDPDYRNNCKFAIYCRKFSFPCFLYLPALLSVALF